MQQLTSTNAEDVEYPVGEALLDWIERSDDFPVQMAHEVNRRRESKARVQRLRKFTDEQDDGWMELFVDNPWQKVEGPLLDLGCRDGADLEYCAARGVRPLAGVDIGAVYVDKAQARVPQASIRQADFLSLPFESDSFNAIIARGSLDLTTTKGLLAALREAYRVLRAGGLIYIHRRFKPALLDLRRARRISLFTYLVYRRPLLKQPVQKIRTVRNFMPEQQLTSLIRSVGFVPLGEPAARVFRTPDGRGDVPCSVAYICMKKPRSVH